MDVSKLVRDKSKIHACLTKLPDGRVVTSKQVRIHIPARFATRDLAYVGVDNYILGVYAMIVDDQFYAVSLINAMIPIDPSSTAKIKVGDDEYYEFTFEPGSTVIKSVMLVKTDTLAYEIYDELLSNGHMPWYVQYDEVGKLFDSSKKHAGANIGENKEVTQLIASIVARSRKDRTKSYRTSISSLKDLVSNPPVFVPLKSIEYAATNAVTKLGGSYFSVGVVSAINDPSDRVERIEDILRR